MTPAIGTCIVILIALLAGVYSHFFDRDVGGYKDGFFTTAQMPDKVVHFLLGALLFMTLSHHYDSLAALLAVVLIGLCYEIGQGYVSVYDWLADMAGAGVAYIYLRFL